MPDPTRSQVSDWNVKWNGAPVGLVDKVTPDLKLITKPIKFGTTGDIPIGERIIGLEGTVKVEVREIDALMLKTFTPWATAGAVIPMIPGTVHKDLYDYAQQLVLHPTHLDASDTTQDLIFLKAVPRMPSGAERDGVKDNVNLLEFSFYPDRTQLFATPPVVAYGTIGTAAA